MLGNDGFGDPWAELNEFAYYGYVSLASADTCGQKKIPSFAGDFLLEKIKA